MPTLRPHLLTIGVHRLRGRGLSARHAATLLAGYDAAIRLLDTAQPVHPTLILLDLHAEEPGFAEFAAPQLAAVLAHRMHYGALHPAWLIGLHTDPNDDRVIEAEIAGCQLVFPAPTTDEQRQELLAVIRTPVPPIVPDHASSAYHLAAERVLRAVQAAQITLWTADEARILLGYLTRYPVPEAPRSHTQRVLRALGGLDAAYERLHAIAVAWQAQHPLYAAILWQFLDGAQRTEIVSYFVSRDLYEDSRIYACIKQLPERIARELRIAQLREGR